MPPESQKRGSPQEWLRFAKGNLELARRDEPPGGLWEPLCFEAQQAAEKAVKAVLIHLGVDFPRTHNLQVLLGLVEATGLKVPPEIWEADQLTEYTMEGRYPGGTEPLSQDEHRQAQALAEAVVRWAERQVSSGKGC